MMNLTITEHSIWNILYKVCVIKCYLHLFDSYISSAKHSAYVLLRLILMTRVTFFNPQIYVSISPLYKCEKKNIKDISLCVKTSFNIQLCNLQVACKVMKKMHSSTWVRRYEYILSHGEWHGMFKRISHIGNSENCCLV